MWRVSTTLYLLLIVGLVIGNVRVYQEIFAAPILKVTKLDVGEKGSAILVLSPNGKTLLIDAGRDASILRALGSILPVWQRELDAVIITNQAAGSAGGLPDIEKRYKITNLIRSAHRGDRYSLGDGVFVDILWPPHTATPMSSADSAIILRLSYGATSFLIQNNLPPRIIKYLSALDSNLPSPDLVISSSTLTARYISDGTKLMEK